MSHNNHDVIQLSMNPLALSCYAVSICSLSGAALGLISSHFPSMGLASVGGFYLFIGAVSHLTGKTASNKSAYQSTGKSSDADNIVMQPMSEGQVSDLKSNLRRDLSTASR